MNDALALAIGFTAVVVPYLIFAYFRGRRLSRHYDQMRRERDANRLAERRSAQQYHDLCRKNGWPVPLSTDDFYEGFVEPRS